MKILGLTHITELYGRAESRTWVSAWVSEVRYATWKRASDVITHFPSAVQVAVDRFRFFSPEPRAYVEVSIAYPQGIVLIVFAGMDGHGL